MGILDFIFSINTLQALVLIAGIIFLIIEMFNPGFGVFGIIGVILVGAGIIITAKSFVDGLLLILIIVIILGIAIIFALRSATKGKLSKKMILKDSLSKDSGFSSTEDMTYFLNKKGTAVTTLRPAGIGEFEGVKLDIVTEGEFIKAGSNIEIINVVGRRIIVREIIG